MNRKHVLKKKKNNNSHLFPSLIPAILSATQLSTIPHGDGKFFHGVSA
jgi:hypothetical protein